MNTLAELHTFGRWALPADTIICWRNGTAIDLAELQQRAATLAGQLAGSGTGQRWLLWCDDSFEFLVGLLALWQAGHCAVLPANAQPETLQRIGSDCCGVLSDVLAGALPTPASVTEAGETGAITLTVY